MVSAPPRFERVAGVDFTTRPRRAKPIVVALGRVEPEGGPSRPLTLHLERIETHTGFDGYARWLATPGPWLGAFDLPFGLPRELVETLGWPTEWTALIGHYAALTRQEARDAFAAFCAARPAGSKFAHRACDGPAGSSPSMKWANPPVAWMLHAGVPLLLAAGLHLPAVDAPAGDPSRVAVEGYPGLLAREVLGRRSYKSDDPAKRTAARRDARRELVDALAAGRTRLGVRLVAGADDRERLADDASGDRLDAVLCLAQAAWAAVRPGFGLPKGVDRLEGWIASA